MKKWMIACLAVFLVSVSAVSAGLLMTKGINDIAGIKMENLCIDTDANKPSPEFKRGYVQDTNGIYWDECNPDPDGPDLIERACDNGFIKDKLVTCEKGCYLGVCAKYTLFRIPKNGQLPASQTFLSLSRLTESRYEDKKNTKYQLNLFNLMTLNTILQDIDNRLKILEINQGIGEAYPLVVRLTNVKSISDNVVVEMKYYNVTYDGKIAVAEISAIDPDLEIFVENGGFKKIIGSLDDQYDIKAELSELYDDGKLKAVALSDKGKVAKVRGIEIISQK